LIGHIVAGYRVERLQQGGYQADRHDPGKTDHRREKTRHKMSWHAITVSDGEATQKLKYKASPTRQAVERQ
jgi:hypothetical protein